MADTAVTTPLRSPLSRAADRLAAATRTCGGTIRLAELPFLTQINVRLDPKGAAADAVGPALGLTLPAEPDTVVRAGELTALWLGPDEWLVIDTGGGDPVADCAKAKALHSAVDISQRNTAILVEGAGAEDVLSAGCPQDLSLAAFPVGACSRTVLGKIEAVVWRTGEKTFRVECWRSFSTYAFDLLEDAARSA